MTVIEIKEERLEEALKVLEHRPTVIPIAPPTTYYVADEVVELLELKHIPFGRVIDERVVQFAAHMLADAQEAFEDIRKGRFTTVSSPLSAQKLSVAARRNGGTGKRG